MGFWVWIHNKKINGYLRGGVCRSMGQKVVNLGPIDKYFWDQGPMGKKWLGPGTKGQKTAGTRDHRTPPHSESLFYPRSSQNILYQHKQIIKLQIYYSWPKVDKESNNRCTHIHTSLLTTSTTFSIFNSLLLAVISSLINLSFFISIKTVAAAVVQLLGGILLTASYEMGLLS